MKNLPLETIQVGLLEATIALLTPPREVLAVWALFFFPNKWGGMLLGDNRYIYICQIQHILTLPLSHIGSDWLVWAHGCWNCALSSSFGRSTKRHLRFIATWCGSFAITSICVEVLTGNGLLHVTCVSSRSSRYRRSSWLCTCDWTTLESIVDVETSSMVNLK